MIAAASRRAAVAGCAALLLGAAAPAQEPVPAAVTVEPVRREVVREQRTVTGELRAVRRSEVATQEPGVVIGLPVREGQRVEAGAVLARLDSTLLAVELEALEADEAATASLIEERSATLSWRQRELELYRKSAERGAANPKELLDAEAEAAIAAARARQAQRQREVIRARAALLNERIADMTVTAPFDGVVVGRRAELGEWLGEGDPVVELVSTGRIEAWLNVPQRFFEAVAVEARGIEVTVDATGGTISAAQRRVIPQVDPRARTFSVVVGMDDAGGRLTPGMSVTAWLPTGGSSEQLTISRDAILRNDAGPFVYAARGGEGEGPASAVPVPVQVLFPVGDRAAVAAPALREGTLIVVEGNERLFPMMKIVPIVRGAAPGGTGR